MSRIKSTITKVNDDGWIVSIILCFLLITISLWNVKLNFILLSFLTIGVLYEHTIEWLAHGWLQHHSCEIFKFFNWRHSRHHKNPKIHHALQPISVLIPMVSLILSPFILILILSSSQILSSGASGIIVGFLLAHIHLNLLHFDIHSEKKIFPKIFRKSRYYRKIYSAHMEHHIEHKTGVTTSKYRIYSISNPWLDIFFEKIGLTPSIDKLYPKLIFLLENMFLNK